MGAKYQHPCPLKEDPGTIWSRAGTVEVRGANNGKNKLYLESQASERVGGTELGVTVCP